MDAARPDARKAAWILGCAVLVVFGPTVFGGFAWDDLPVIRDNDRLHSFASFGRLFTDDFWAVSDPGAAIVSGYFRPVVKGAWLVLWVVSDGAAWLFHGLNVLLHLAAVLLAIGWIRRRLEGSGVPSERAGIASVLGAAVFAFHPSRAESVGWVVGATDLWLGVFVLLAAWAWDRVEGARGLALASGFAALALFSKESALLLPVVLAVDLAWTKREGLAARSWRGLAVITAVVAAAFGWRVGVVPLRSMHVESTVPEVLRRVLATVGYYTRVLLAPMEPSALSGETGLDAQGLPLAPGRWMLLGLVVVGLTFVGLAIAWFRGRREWIADIAWFVVFLAPVLNVTPLGYSMLGSERFLYVPMLGVAVLVARGLAGWAGRDSAGEGAASFRKPVLVVAAVALLWASLSFVQALRFGDSRALWTDARERHPYSPYAADMLARALWTDGDAAAALDPAAYAVRANVDGPARLRSLSLWFQLLAETTPDTDRDGLRALHAQVETAARATVRTSVAFGNDRLVMVDPALLSPIVNAPGFRTMRATLAARVGMYDLAESLLRDSLALDPQRLSTHVNLFRVLVEAGRPDDARKSRDEALLRLADPEARLVLQSLEPRSPP